MSYAIDRAIERGIDTARIAGKEADSEYSERHPMFRWFWAALVKSYDHRDWSMERVRKAVLTENRPK